MTMEKVSKDKEIDKRVEQKQKADEPREELLKVKNQSKIQESKQLKGRPIIIQETQQNNIEMEKKKSGL